MSRQRNNGRYVLRVQGRRAWLESAGITMTELVISPPQAHTTQSIGEAMKFQNYRQAERMRQLLIDKYGLKTTIIRRD